MKKYPKPTTFNPYGSNAWCKEFTKALKNPNFNYVKPDNLSVPKQANFSSKREYENELRAYHLINSIGE